MASETYPIHPKSCSGHITYLNDEGVVVEHEFHAINAICTHEEMELFNMTVLNMTVAEKLYAAAVGDRTPILAVKWSTE